MSPEGKPRHFIKEWRKYRRMTQEEVASAIGGSVSSISQLENGKQGYSQTILEALAEIFQCTPVELLSVNPIEQHQGSSRRPSQNAAVSLISLLDNLRSLADAHPERLALALEALERLTDQPDSAQNSGTKDNR
ncbi:helix-turn-helix domain-containing protein [Sinorhizobium meliloti]|uniref:helix-turn-helix domain-containing protein n=1 Tax=Rhizobium meliloti TaxID=382 RepID=UPI003F16899C